MSTNTAQKDFDVTTTQDTNALVKRLLALANCEADELADALTEAATTLDALAKDRDEWRESTIMANKNAANEEKSRRDMQEQRDALQAKLDDAGRQEPPQNHIYCVFDKTYRLHFWSRAEADKVRSQFSCSTMPFLERIDLLDAHPAPQAAAPQPLEYNTWTHNDGDTWSENPADAEIIYDLLGDNPKVGDKFQLRASVESVQQTYRITSVSPDGECEVELVEAAHGIGSKP